MKELINTEWCYMGYSENEDCYVIGSYSELYKDQFIDNNTIEFSADDWHRDEDYFLEYLRKEIAAYERRYRTSVTHIGMIGSVGVWTGRHVGGKLIKYDENLFESLGCVDEIRVYLDDDNTLRINGYHHDGCHSMTLHFITENKLKKMAPDMLNWNDYDSNDIECIYNNDKPFKVTSIFDQYFNRGTVAAA